MGVSSQAPHATPGQRQMEMHHVLFYVFSMLLQQDHIGMYKVSNAKLQHTIIK